MRTRLLRRRRTRRRRGLRNATRDAMQPKEAAADCKESATPSAPCVFVFVIVMAAAWHAACRPRMWPTGSDPLTLESLKSGLDVGHFYLAARLSFAGAADVAAVLQTWYLSTPIVFRRALGARFEFRIEN